jgi:hypothetical protein
MKVILDIDAITGVEGTRPFLIDINDVDSMYDEGVKGEMIVRMIGKSARRLEAALTKAIVEEDRKLTNLSSPLTKYEKMVGAAVTH